MSSRSAPPPSFSLRVPEGDTRSRRVCDACGFVDYVNPRVVVGAVCAWEDRLLLCRRAIDPGRGRWTIPAGFLEENETVEEGARREAMEEARAAIELQGLLGLYSVPRISQVQLFFRARLLSPRVEVGEETLEVGLVAWDAIPWGELAFPTVHWALRHYREVAGLAVFAPRGNPPGDRGELGRREPERG
jgi:ADP-ribose pyrophosphatase YjhB (NUDIX family)